MAWVDTNVNPVDVIVSEFCISKLRIIKARAFFLWNFKFGAKNEAVEYTMLNY